jgi:hypothetical protein
MADDGQFLIALAFSRGWLDSGGRQLPSPIAIANRTQSPIANRTQSKIKNQKSKIDNPQ